MSSNSSLSDRLFRYSASASLVTAGLIATIPQAAMAGGTITNDWGSSGFTLPSSSFGISTPFDVDGFGDNDLAIIVRSGASPGGQIQLIAQGMETFSIIGASSFIFQLPYVLTYGAPISSLASPWVPRGTQPIILTSSAVPLPIAFPWSSQDGTEKNYVGFHIQGDDGNPHYGWIELKVTSAANGGPTVTIYRTAIDSPAGSGLPADVSLTQASASGGLHVAVTTAFAALGGALTWFRRKLRL